MSENKHRTYLGTSWSRRSTWKIQQVLRYRPSSIGCLGWKDWFSSQCSHCQYSTERSRFYQKAWWYNDKLAMISWTGGGSSNVLMTYLESVSARERVAAVVTVDGISNWSCAIVVAVGFDGVHCLYRGNSKGSSQSKRGEEIVEQNIECLWFYCKWWFWLLFYTRPGMAFNDRWQLWNVKDDLKFPCLHSAIAYHALYPAGSIFDALLLSWRLRVLCPWRPQFTGALPFLSVFLLYECANAYVRYTEDLNDLRINTIAVTIPSYGLALSSLSSSSSSSHESNCLEFSFWWCFSSRSPFMLNIRWNCK